MERIPEINLYHADNMNFMPTKASKCYDLVIPDPPYGIGAIGMQMGSSPNKKEKGQYPSISTAVKSRKNRLNQGSGKLKNRILNTSNCEWDETPPPPEYFEELFRISKNQIIWGGNYFDLPPTRCIICWDKVQPWENFSQWEMAWTSFDKPAAMVRISNTGGINKKKKIHPTEKPILLYKWLLNKFATPGMKIIDTHGGSMNLAIACYDLGFDCDIIEKDIIHFNDGKEQFEKHKLKCEEIQKYGYAKTELSKINPTLF